MKNFANFILFQAGWMAAVYFGSNQKIFLGFFLMILFASVSILFSENKKNKFLFMISICFLGTFFDSLMKATGFFSFVHDPLPPWNYPIWMSALWYGFASTVDLSMSWLRGKYLYLTLFGLSGGASSYYAGSKFGEMLFPSGLVLSLVAIGIFWAIMSPLIFVIAEKFKLFTE